MEQAEDIWRCDHDETAIRRRVRSNGVTAYGHQCLQCGAWLREVAKASPEVTRLASIDDYDAGLAARWADDQRAVWQARQAAVATERDRERAEWRARHMDYLLTPRWGRKREAVLKRAKGVCEGCGEKTATEVHHLSYVHHGDEFLFELVALCRPCHARWHNKVDPTVRLTSRAGGAA